MDARQLRYFLAIVDHGGFGRAAAHLYVSQPSLSQAIAALERELGIDLFYRVGRRATVSTAGEALVGPARLVLRDLEAAKSAMDEIRGVRGGRVDVSAMPSPAVEPLTSIIVEFARRHPDVRVALDGAFTPDDVVDAVRSGSVEVGVLGSATPARPPGLRAVRLAQQPMVLIVNPSAPGLPPGPVVARQELAGSRFIVSPRGSLMRSVVDDILADGIPVQIAVEVAHRTTILPLVLSGVGHAVMPSAWIPLATAAGLRTMNIEGAPVLHVSLISRLESLTPAASAFIDVAVELFEATHR